MGSMVQIAEPSFRTPATVKVFAVLNALMLATARPVAQAASCTADPDARTWTVAGDAATDTDISGAACAPDGRCLLVSLSVCGAELRSPLTLSGADNFAP